MHHYDFYQMLGSLSRPTEGIIYSTVFTAAPQVLVHYIVPLLLCTKGIWLNWAALSLLMLSLFFPFPGNKKLDVIVDQIKFCSQTVLPVSPEQFPAAGASQSVLESSSSWLIRLMVDDHDCCCNRLSDRGWLLRTSKICHFKGDPKWKKKTFYLGFVEERHSIPGQNSLLK